MKKLLFAVALIGVLIGSTLGGIALADKPEGVNPIDNINQNVSDIKDEVTHPNYGLEEIKTEVAAIEGNITDPIFGLEAIEDEVDSIQSGVGQIGMAIALGIGPALTNIANQLSDPATGLAEIKAEVAAIEGNVTELKAEIASIKNSIEEIPYMMPCTPGVLEVDINFIDYSEIAPGIYEWLVHEELEVVGHYPVYNADVDLFINGNKLDSQHWDVLVPDELYFVDLEFVYNNIVNDLYIVVRASGATPWGECLTAHDTYLYTD